MLVVTFWVSSGLNQIIFLLLFLFVDRRGSNFIVLLYSLCFKADSQINFALLNVFFSQDKFEIRLLTNFGNWLTMEAGWMDFITREPMNNGNLVSFQGPKFSDSQFGIRIFEKYGSCA